MEKSSVGLPICELFHLQENNPGWTGPIVQLWHKCYEAEQGLSVRIKIHSVSFSTPGTVSLAKKEPIAGEVLKTREESVIITVKNRHDTN